MRQLLSKHTNTTILPLEEPNLDDSHESWLDILAAIFASFVPGGLPGGPFDRLDRFGCLSATCSDLLFFVSGFGLRFMPESTSFLGSVALLGIGRMVDWPEVVCVEAALELDASSTTGTSAFPSLSFS